MPFTHPAPDWNAQGAEPPESLRTNGWQINQKPPADYFNWFFYNSAKAIIELQLEAINTDQKGVANGVATLGANGKVPSSQLPTLASTATDITITDAGNYFTTKNVEFAIQNYGAHRQNTSIHLSTQDRTDLTNAQKAKLVQDSNGLAFNVTTTVRPLSAGFYVYKGTSTDWMPAGAGNHVITNKRYTFGGISTIFVHQTIEYQAGSRYWAVYNDDTQAWSGWTRIVDEVDTNNILSIVNSNYNDLAGRTTQIINALTGGATVTGTGNAVYKEGRRVFFELICSLPSGMTAGTVIHTLSTALRPSKLTYMPIQASNNQFVQFAINASGQVIVNTAITSATAVSIYNSFAISPER